MIETHIKNSVILKKVSSNKLSEKNTYSPDEIHFVKSLLELGESIEALAIGIKSNDESNKQITKRIQSIEEKLCTCVTLPRFDKEISLLDKRFLEAVMLRRLN